MKKFSLVLALLMLITVGNAQVVRSTFPTAVEYLAQDTNSATVTSTAIPIVVTEGIIGVAAQNQLPDSIRIIHYATSDSIKADVYISVATDTTYGANVQVDSVKSGALGYVTLSGSYFTSGTSFKVIIVRRSAGNAKKPKSCLFTAKVQKYFKVK